MALMAFNRKAFLFATHNLHTKAIIYGDKSGHLVNEEYSILCSL